MVISCSLSDLFMKGKSWFLPDHWLCCFDKNKEEANSLIDYMDSFLQDDGMGILDCHFKKALKDENMSS